MSTNHAPRASTRRRQVKALMPGVKREKPQPKQPETWGERLRHYAPSVVGPLAVLALTVVVVCLAVILIAGLRVSYLPGSIGQAWLSVNAAPMRISGVALSNAPTLPAIGIAALIASRVRSATKERVSVLDLAAILTLLVGSSITLSAIALFMVTDASYVYAFEAPNPAAALFAPLGVHLIGFIFGVSPVVWRALARRVNLPELIVDATLAATRLLRNLFLVSLGVYLVMLAVQHARVGEALAAYPHLGWVGGLALALLSLAYVPNAAVATMSVLLGGSFDYADASVSLFSTTSAALPPFPLFAAVPATVGTWAPALMLIPAAVLVRFVLTRSFSLIDATATATIATTLSLLMVFYTGGAVGAYGWVGANPWTCALAVFIWTAVAGLATWAIARFRRD
ncbi:cell division protein PerM [Corynebacterium riegelii]|uniref:cell division protein PerM n=1 Tax=Corynebacterium riegelii TaxID=156976 RepID=UPI0012EE3181|nr:DUF6350 family protein [Corynebacterium riegelii]